MKPRNLIALIAFLAASVWTLTLSDSTVRAIQKNYYLAITPFLSSGSDLEQKAKNFLQEYQHSEIWKTKYNLAKQELDKKRMEVAHLRKLESQNAQLQHALQFQQQAPFHVLAANITRRQASTWWQTITINRGLNHNIDAQLPVLAPEGLVGKVDIVSQETSTVILLTDEKCQVSSKVDGSPEIGILSGQRGISGAHPTLRLKYLSKDAKIKPGTPVYTTGRGGIFPPDILLGTIQTFEPGPLYGEAIVTPAVDFETLNTVFIKLPHSIPEISASETSK